MEGNTQISIRSQQIQKENNPMYPLRLPWAKVGLPYQQEQLNAQIHEETEQCSTQ